MNRVAVVIPCFNEAIAIGKVVADFRAALPNAIIYVYDNNSHDGTPAVAASAGAVVRSESQQGKGHVIARAFADVDAEIYVLVDGDNTYDAAAAPAMIRMLVAGRLDMVTGTRVTDPLTKSGQAAFRPGHRFGNAMLTGAVRTVFGKRITDMLSGYRVFSRRFVKSFPARSAGFETETEFTVHGMELAMPLGEMQTTYLERPLGTASKLRTFADGARILRTIVVLVKNERPMQFFGAFSLLFLASGLLMGLPVVGEYFETGLVPRLPRAVLALGLVLLCFLSLFAGLILDSVARGRRDTKRLAYLSHPPVEPDPSEP